MIYLYKILVLLFCIGGFAINSQASSSSALHQIELKMALTARAATSDDLISQYMDSISGYFSADAAQMNHWGLQTAEEALQLRRIAGQRLLELDLPQVLRTRVIGINHEPHPVLLTNLVVALGRMHQALLQDGVLSTHLSIHSDFELKRALWATLSSLNADFIQMTLDPRVSVRVAGAQLLGSAFDLPMPVRLWASHRDVDDFSARLSTLLFLINGQPREKQSVRLAALMSLVNYKIPATQDPRILLINAIGTPGQSREVKVLTQSIRSLVLTTTRLIAMHYGPWWDLGEPSEGHPTANLYAFDGAFMRMQTVSPRYSSVKHELEAAFNVMYDAYKSTLLKIVTDRFERDKDLKVESIVSTLVSQHNPYALRVLLDLSLMGPDVMPLQYKNLILQKLFERARNQDRQALTDALTSLLQRKGCASALGDDISNQSK